MIAKDIMREKFVKVDKEDRVSELLGQLKNENQTIGFVFDKNEFRGIVTLKDLVKTRMAKEQKLGKVIWHVPSIPEDEDLIDIAVLMFHSNASGLPVLRNEKVVGVVLASDVVKQVRNIPELKTMKVSEIRHPVAKTIKEHDRIGKAFEMMMEEDINRLPVVDEKNKPIGMISFGDIMKRLLIHPMSREGGIRSTGPSGPKGFKGEKEDILAMPVKSFASMKELVTAKPGDTLGKIVDLMEKNDVSGIMVSENEEVDSIITKRDLLEALMNTKKVVVKNIQFIGLNELKETHPYLKEYIKKISSYYAEKISFMVKNINAIKVHIKEHTKGGKVHKYSVHVHVSAPNIAISSTKASDWDISRVMHKAFKEVEKQIIHRLKSDTSHKKRYY